MVVREIQIPQPGPKISSSGFIARCSGTIPVYVYSVYYIIIPTPNACVISDSPSFVQNHDPFEFRVFTLISNKMIRFLNVRVFFIIFRINKLLLILKINF